MTVLKQFYNCSTNFKKLNIPAIFFLCPKNIDKQQMFWVDKIEACINLTSKKKLK